MFNEQSTRQLAPCARFNPGPSVAIEIAIGRTILKFACRAVIDAVYPATRELGDISGSPEAGIGSRISARAWSLRHHGPRAYFGAPAPKTYRLSKDDDDLQSVGRRGLIVALQHHESEHKRRTLSDEQSLSGDRLWILLCSREYDRLLHVASGAEQ